MQQQLQTEEAKTDVAKIVENLSSKQADQREEAEQTLEQLGPQAVDDLLAVLEQEAQKRKRNIRSMCAVVASIFGFMLLMVLVVSLMMGKFAWMMLSGMSGFAGAIGVAAAATQGQKNASKALAGFDDVRAVGPLAQAREFGDKDLRAVCDAALIRLLPRLQANHANLLDKEQRARLNRALNGKNTELTLAVLTAWQQVGDESAIPVVEKLAAGEGCAAKNGKIKDAAKECLSFLQQRAEAQRARQTLLRASMPSETSPDMLLRAAEGATTADPQQLLRAGIVQEHSE